MIESIKELIGGTNPITSYGVLRADAWRDLGLPDVSVDARHVWCFMASSTKEYHDAVNIAVKLFGNTDKGRVVRCLTGLELVGMVERKDGYNVFSPPLWQAKLPTRAIATS